MAIKIDGKALAEEIKSTVKAEVTALSARGIEPCLAVVMVGNNQASSVYVSGKQKDCEDCGIKSRLVHLPQETTQEELLSVIALLSIDQGVHGILVQLPLPKHIDDQTVIDSIPAEKDVDGFNPINIGKLVIGEDGFLPCTPAGVIVMLKSVGIELAGKKAVVLGRSNIVGKPAAMLLLRENATVTVCHSKTENLKEICADADVIVAAIGKANFVTADMIKEGAVVIDVGINRGDDGKLCGDVLRSAAEEKAAYYSPVPGGVGLMTRAMLLVNTVRAAHSIEWLKH